MQIHFKHEDFLRQQIEIDASFFMSTNLGKVYLISEEILLNYEWNGQFFGKCSNNDDQYISKCQFHYDKQTHMQIYVSRLVRINEFIIMIKNRFFKNIDNIELEDIWLYRVKEHNDDQQKMQYF